MIVIFRSIIIVAFVILISVANQANATTRYVALPGTNVSGEWVGHMTSVSQVNATVQPGDTVKFAPGRYTGYPLIPPYNQDPNRTTYFVCSTWVSVDDPGEESNWNQTIITGAQQVTGWSQVSGSIYRAAWDGGNAWPADDWLAAVTWGATDSLLKPATTSALNEGETYYDAGGRYLYVWLHGGNNPSSQTIYASRQPSCHLRDGQTHRDYMYFAGIDFRIGRPGVVTLYLLTNNTTFYHCDLSRVASTIVVGNGGVVHATAQQDDLWGGYHNFIGCKIGWAKDTSPSNSDGSGASLYSQHHVVFDSCTFHNVQATGIYFKEAYGTTAKDTASVVKYCTFDSTIGRFGIELYRNNYMDSVYGNIFYGIKDEGGAVRINDGSDYDNVGRLFIANNTFYNCAYSIVARYPDQLGGNQIKYNISCDKNSSGPWVRFANDALNSFEIDHNMWHDPDQSSTFDSAYSILSWSQWQGRGHDVNGVVADPEFDSAWAQDPWQGLARSNAGEEINITYGGRTWTKYGAVQEAAVPCTPPEATTLAGPTDNTTFYVTDLQDSLVQLTWNPVVAEGSISYRLQISEDPSFSEGQLSINEIVYGTNYYAGGYGASHLSDGTGTWHYFRVIARSGNCEGEPSASRRFQLVDQAPPQFVAP